MLVASHVIHVVGPRYRVGQDNAGMLRDATVAALDAAAEHGLESVAFPAISAGIFGYPAAEATAVMTAALREWIETHPDLLTEIRLVGFSDEIARHFADAVAADAAAQSPG